MTDNQKKLWNMLPVGEWVKRSTVHNQYGKWNFQLSLSFLYNKKLIELKFIDSEQYIRRKTIEEIQASKLEAMQKQTDNSYLEGKIQLRLESLQHIQSDEVMVLEAFGGDGVIWSKVKERTDKQIRILRIDKKQDKRGVYLKGDNLKFLKAIDLTLFHIVDLDAYGSPFNQLEIVFRRRYHGIVHCTYIQTGMGQINKKLLEKLGYTARMVDKCPTLFSRQPFSKMLSYLSLYGVKEIRNVQATDRKNYFYFFL